MPERDIRGQNITSLASNNLEVNFEGTYDLKR